MLTVTGQSLGRKKPLFDDFAVPPPPAAAGGSLTLRDLIGHVVRAEVAAFAGRQAGRRVLRALTARQVADGLAAGKVSAGGSDLDQAVDPDAAVEAAVTAFADGLYLVVLNGAEVRDLDAPLAVPADSRLAFVRLTLLAGG